MSLHTQRIDGAAFGRRPILVVLIACGAWAFLTCRGGLAAEAPATPPEQALGAKGLTRVGNQYLLDADLNLRAQLRDMRRAKSRMEVALSQRARIEDQVTLARNGLIQLYDQLQEIDAAIDKLKAKKHPTRYNELVNKAHQTEARITEVDQYLANQQKAAEAIEVPSDDYFASVVAISDSMGAAQKRYDELAADADVKAALAAVGAAEKIRVALGPSSQFSEEFASVMQQRRKINSDVINFTSAGGVPMIEATLNGSLHKRMIIDSGAAAVVLTWEVARELGMNPGSHDRRVSTRTADGKIVSAYAMTIDSVRVGPFSVQNVECFVLPDGVGADLLLGDTFWRHFVYRIDLSARQLHLLQIGADKSDATASTSPPPDAPASPRPAGSPASPSPASHAPIVLTAAAAVIHGSAKLKAADGADDPRIEHWNDPATYLSWDHPIPAGNYAVDITYSCSKRDAGGGYDVAAGADWIIARVAPTGGWDDFQTQRIGTLHLAQGAGELRITVTTRPRSFLMRFHRVTLTSSRAIQSPAPASVAPLDPAANLAAGKVLCFDEGKWSRGLLLLAEGADPKLQELAKNELNAHDDPSALAKAADGWWDFAPTLKDPASMTILRHAASLYQRAKSGLSGLHRDLAEKRIQQVTGSHA